MDITLKDEIKTGLTFIKEVIDRSLYSKSKETKKINDSELMELITISGYLAHSLSELENGQKVSEKKLKTIIQMLAKIEEFKTTFNR